MHLPLYVPKWAITGLLLLVGCLAGWQLLDSSDSANDRRSTLLPQSNSWFEAPRWSPGVDENRFDPEDRELGEPETHEGGFHMGVVQRRNGEWRVVGTSPRSSGSNGVARAMPITRTGSSGGGSPAVAVMNPSSPLVIPPFFGEALFTPLAGAPSRAVAFSEWESYRTDVAGENILVTTDDSNFFRDRNGQINGNTGDTDASGLNVVDASDSVIYGTESADFPPWAPEGSGEEEDPDEPEDEEDDPEEPDELDDAALDSTTVINSVAAMLARAPDGVAVAAVVEPSECDPDGDDCDDDSVPAPTGSASTEFDFPYVEWVASASRGVATSVHTDEGTTLASGADALVIGGDGYDDDDNRAAGRNIIITRDDGNVVVGGTGDVNAQIGDSEQGAVIMDVEGVFIQGGGAY